MRIMKHCVTMLLLAAVVSSIAACSWMGETAGRAKAGVEEAITDTKEGYNKGYNQGKAD